MEGRRIELIQIPQPASVAFEDYSYVGYYHLSFDITDVRAAQLVTNSLERTFYLCAKKTQPASEVPTPKGAFLPTQQQIGDRVSRSRLYCR